MRAVVRSLMARANCTRGILAVLGAMRCLHGDSERGFGLERAKESNPHDRARCRQLLPYFDRPAIWNAMPQFAEQVGALRVNRLEDAPVVAYRRDGSSCLVAHYDGHVAVEGYR
jgi:hypothetical protein